jgi:polar amino acid transport system substrate-binding protein
MMLRSWLIKAMCALPLIMGLPATWAAEVNTPLKVVYFQDYPPFSSGAGEQVHGVFIDILQEALVRRMKQPILNAGYPWERAQYMVKQGEADAFVTAHNPDRKLYTDASSETLFTAEIKFYVRKNHPDIDKIMAFTQVAQFKPYKIGSYIGAGWTKTNLGGFDITYFPLSESLFRSAAKGLVDASPDIAAMARPYIVRLGLKEELAEVPHSFDTLHYRLCIRKNSNFTKLLPEFDKTLKAMRNDGTLAEIMKKNNLQ